MRARIIEPVAFGVFAFIYYVFLAQPMMFWVVDRLTNALSLGIGPALAALWCAAEIGFFVVPFIAIRVWAGRSKQSGLPNALAALAAFWVPLLLAAAASLAFAVPVPAFSGIDGAVASWLALAADLVASAIGLGLVVVANGGGKASLSPAPAN